MQQRENAQQGLVRMDRVVGGPTLEQRALTLQKQGTAGEATGFLDRQTGGGIDKDNFVTTGEAEELAQHAEPMMAGLGQHGEEGLNVVHVDQRPVDLAAMSLQEHGQIT
ncbi:MAG: hypothetical protein M3021_00385, partial [Actinomycetota bacterium]|nr:hypothetical protein [Actinomycetota bacterium]